MAVLRSRVRCDDGKRHLENLNFGLIFFLRVNFRAINLSMKEGKGKTAKPTNDILLGIAVFHVVLTISPWNFTFSSLITYVFQVRFLRVSAAMSASAVKRKAGDDLAENEEEEEEVEEVSL